MTGQQLRNSILQEAIQGRLVPNVLEPGEKTGEELLIDILAERQKRENKEKGKKARKLTLSTIEEEPWVLPDSWCWCKLGDICTFTAGQSPDGKDINEQEGVEFHQGKIYFGDLYLRQASIFTKRVSKIAHKGSVLLCMRAPVGFVNITQREICIGRGLSAIEPYFPLSSLFLCYWLRSYKDYFEERATGSTFKAITGEIVKETPIPLPPLSIQNAIIKKIEKLFPLVDEFDKAAGELETLNKILPDKLRKSVLQDAIRGALVTNDIPKGEATASELLQQILKEQQDRENKQRGKKAKKLSLSEIEEEPWDLPEGWCWCKLGDIGSWGAGATPSRGNAAFYQGGTIPWLKTGELNNGFVCDTEEKVTALALEKCSLRLCQPGDVLIAMYGATIGKLAIAGAPLTTNQACCACTPYNGVYNKYLFFFLLAKKDNFTKQAFGGAQPNISKEKIVGTDFPLPPLSVQHRIVEKIEEVFSAIEKLQS